MEALKTYLQEIKNIPLLTARQEVELSNKIRKGDEHARKAMIRSNLRLVINIAKRYIFLGSPFLDLIEEGNLGLMKAVDKFNPKKGFRFSTYAAWWIRQAIMRSIGQQDKTVRLPVYMNELIAKWKRTREQLTQKLNRLPTSEEIAKKLRISKTKMNDINYWQTSKTSSLDEPIGEEGDNQIMDMIEDATAISPSDEVERFFNKERMDDLLDKMAPREKKVLNMRFGMVDGKPRTLAEVADKLKVSRERIRQIEEKALMKLKKMVEEQEKR
jgi:RNA polymerase primary sigma factor